MNRRTFLAATGVTGLGLTMSGLGTGAAAAQETDSVSIGGTDLQGWETVVGDGLYVAAGELPVSLADIETHDLGTHSELVTNVRERNIMAHNIAFKRVIDDSLLNASHTCSYEFRLPVVPSINNASRNGQTVEGGFFVWDGAATRRDYGLGFQWILNPWDPQVGGIQKWHMSGWKTTHYVEPDSEWHRIDIEVDPRTRVACLMFDGIEIDTVYTRRQKPGYWGTEIAGRLQVEAISLFPDDGPNAPQHIVEARNWQWTYAGGHGASPGPILSPDYPL
ncbi:MAG: hypothetical protein ACI8TP_004085 [Acidimicrobiales bacterium]|jgi:hypothetical protein